MLHLAVALVQSLNFDAAADYSRQHRGDALLVLRGDSLVFEQYQNGYNSNVPHMLASGTKSFSCAIAVAAAADGLLAFDELAANTIKEFASDSLKKRITIRHLLTLSSGLDRGLSGFEGIRNHRNADALALAMVSTPGEKFLYGSSHYHVFGEVMRRKLPDHDVFAYLERKVLDPIGLTGLRITKDRAGQPHLPGGGFATAREWIKYGKLIRDRGAWNGKQVLRADLLEQCLQPSKANPNYGMTWWLSTAGTGDVDGGRRRNRPSVASPVQVIMAAGAMNQRLYILRDRNLVIVRFGRLDPTWDDASFLRTLSR